MSTDRTLFSHPPAKGLFDIQWQLVPYAADAHENIEYVAFLAARKAQYKCCVEGRCDPAYHIMPLSITLPMDKGMAKEIRYTQRSLFAMLQSILANIKAVQDKFKDSTEAPDEMTAATLHNFTGFLLGLLNDVEYEYLISLDEKVTFDIIEIPYGSAVVTHS